MARFTDRLMAQSPALVTEATSRNAQPILPPMAFAAPELERQRIKAQESAAEKALMAQLSQARESRIERMTERQRQDELNKMAMLFQAGEAENQRKHQTQENIAQRASAEKIAQSQADVWKQVYGSKVAESSATTKAMSARQMAAYQANGDLLFAQTLTNPKARENALNRAKAKAAGFRLEFDQDSGQYHDGEGNTGPPGYRGVRNIFWQPRPTTAVGASPTASVTQPIVPVAAQQPGGAGVSLMLRGLQSRSAVPGTLTDWYRRPAPGGYTLPGMTGPVSQPVVPVVSGASQAGPLFDRAAFVPAINAASTNQVVPVGTDKRQQRFEFGLRLASEHPDWTKEQVIREVFRLIP